MRRPTVAVGYLRLAPGALALQGRADRSAQLLEVNRFRQVVEGTGFERFHRVFGRTVGGDDDAFLGALLGTECVQQFQAQAVGQSHVGDEHIKVLLRQAFARLRQVTSGHHLMALAQQGQLVQRAQIGFVVNDQDGGDRVHGHVQRILGSGTLGRLRWGWMFCGTESAAAEFCRVGLRRPSAAGIKTKNSLPSR